MMKKKFKLLFSIFMLFILMMGCSVCALAAQYIDKVDVSAGEVHEGTTVGGLIDSITVSATGATYETEGTAIKLGNSRLGRDEVLRSGNEYKLEISLSEKDDYSFKADTYYNYLGDINVTIIGTTISNIVGKGAGSSDMQFSITFSLSSSHDPQPDTNSASHTHEWIEGEIYSATQDRDGLCGVYCKTCGAIQSSYPISAYGYTINDYATPMVNASKTGQTVTFEFGEWNSFPKAFMEKVAAKSMEGVTFVFHYKWNHVKQEITIPFGTAVDTNFDWYGPAKMVELYEANRFV